MSKNTRIVLLTLIVAVLCVSILLFLNGLLRRTNSIPCPDGTTRVRVDSNAFQTQYSAYSLKLQGQLKQDNFSAELGANQLRQMSEAIQLARLHLQALTEEYNACIVSPQEFNESRNRYQRMEDIAREIDQLGTRGHLTPSDEHRLTDLVTEYISLSRGK